MDKRGDKLISMYWFVILFLVTGGVVYMAGVFYGTPYDVTDVEERILGNKVADCIAKGGRLRADVFEDDFAENFLEKCGLNFAVEDSFGWNDNQYYVEVGFFEFDVDKEGGFGDLVKTLKVGNPNLKVASEIKQGITGFVVTDEGTSKESSVDKVVIHYTGGWNSRDTVETIALRELGIHYILDREGGVASKDSHRDYFYLDVLEDFSANGYPCKSGEFVCVDEKKKQVFKGADLEGKDYSCKACQSGKVYFSRVIVRDVLVEDWISWTKDAYRDEGEIAYHSGCGSRKLCSSIGLDDKYYNKDKGLLDPIVSYIEKGEPSCCVGSKFNVNSIGIEIVNLGNLCGSSDRVGSCTLEINSCKPIHCVNGVREGKVLSKAYGQLWEVYPDEQIDSLVDLVAGIVVRNEKVKVDRDHILGHDEISTDKNDPGPLFPWDDFMVRVQSKVDELKGVDDVEEDVGTDESDGEDVVEVGVGVNKKKVDTKNRNFYALDGDGKAYLVNVVSLVRKSEKNVK